MIDQNGNNSAIDENGPPGDIPRTLGLMSESLIAIVWRSRWIILATTVAALVAAFVYLQKATPIYTSTSRVYVEQIGPKVMTETEEGIMTRAKNYLYTQAALLRSTPILTQVGAIPGIRQLRTLANVDNLVAYLKNSLQVNIGRKDDLINVSLNSPYPADAAQLVNHVVDAYITYHATQKRSTSAEVLKILQKEKAERGQELSEKLRATMDFKRKNMALAFDSKEGNIIVQKLSRLSTVLTEAQLMTIESESIYKSTKAMVGDPAQLKQFVETQRAKGVYIVAGGKRAELETTLNQLQRRRADRLRQLTADHPAVAALDAEITKARKELDRLDAKFAQSQVAVAEQQYLAAKEKEDRVAKYFEEQRKEAVNLNEQLAQYTILQSEYEQTKKLCDILDDRIKELNITEDVGALNISILEVARPADSPSEPQKARSMAIALVLGLMLGCGIALIRDWMDQRLRSAEEISAILGVPVLGVIPSMSKNQNIVTRGQKVHLDSGSAEAEAFRTVRTAVFFGAPKSETKTILVTSPAAMDGKTTIVSNLAIAMAQAGQKILVLDADFRRPMQHKIFETENGNKGLSSVLAGVTSLKEAIQATKVNGLQVMPCGPDVPNPSEVLNSETFAELLEQLSKEYDRVIVDSPPVMPVTDSQILAARCDITLVVLRADRSTRKVSMQAREGILSVGGKILGVVVNDVSRKSGRYGYYGYYYGPYYGRKKQKSRKKTSAAVI